MRRFRTVRRVLKLLVSANYFAVSGCWRAVAGLWRRAEPSSLVVLMYHQVNRSQATAFGRQLELIAMSGKPVFADFVPSPTTRGTCVAVTFDDGLAEAVDVAAPLLKDKGICSTWFIVTGYAGKDAAWGKTTRKNSGYGGKVASWSDLKRLESSLVRFGSHTASHCHLPDVDQDEARLEIAGSRSMLETALATRVNSISLPHGEYHDWCLKECRKAGYQFAFSNIPVMKRFSRGGFLRGRVPVDPTDWKLEFWLKLRGGYNWLAVTGNLRKPGSVASALTRSAVAGKMKLANLPPKP
jgi:peptidoglycan/xylan/chitin deacetylase (PgdA/CDA1 family)